MVNHKDLGPKSSSDSDEPPPYDDGSVSTSLPSSHASGSSPTDALLSPQQAHLFSGPPNAEDLSSPIPHDVEHIELRHQYQPVAFSRDLTLSRVMATVSTDARASDPEVLCDFLKRSAAHIPKIRLRCTGSYTVMAAKDETVNCDGDVQIRKKIDMTDIVSPAGVNLSILPGATPAYRGKSSLAYGASYAPARGSRMGYTEVSGEGSSTASGLALSWAEQDSLRAWNTKRWGMGFPVWAKLGEIPGTWLGGTDVERHVGPLEDASLREWCETYCADRGWLKQFILRRDVWGWNFDGLVKATKSAIVSTGYDRTLMVRVEWDEAEIVVKPSNIWTEANSNMFIHAALCITLIYPIIWLLNYFGLLPGSGGKYDVARATYNLKAYPPLPLTSPGESLQSARERLPSLIKLHSQIPRDPTLRLGPRGVHYLAGRREGEWFAGWEERIKTAVQMKFKGELTDMPAEPRARGVSLDGYEMNWVEA